MSYKSIKRSLINPICAICTFTDQFNYRLKLCLNHNVQRIDLKTRLKLKFVNKTCEKLFQWIFSNIFINTVKF